MGLGFLCPTHAGKRGADQRSRRQWSIASARSSSSTPAEPDRSPKHYAHEKMSIRMVRAAANAFVRRACRLSQRA